LQKVRCSPECEIIARTINEDRKWKILVSSSSRLHLLNRSEPFTASKEGKQRIVKDQIRGTTITEEQLVIGRNPVFWKAQQKTLNLQDEEQRTENPCLSDHPKQEKLALGSATPGQLGVALASPKQRVPFSYKSRRDLTTFDQSKHGSADFGVKTRNLAFFMARHDLSNEHWDNCKVHHRLAHSFNFALKALRQGCNRKTITKAYSMALHDVHGMAVDQGVTKSGVWPPSSTIHRARSILAENGCHGQWLKRIAKQGEKVIVSAEAET